MHGTFLVWLARRGSTCERHEGVAPPTLPGLNKTKRSQNAGCSYHVRGNHLPGAAGAGKEAAGADDEFVQDEIEAGGQTRWEGEWLGGRVVGQSAPDDARLRTNGDAAASQLGHHTRQSSCRCVTLSTFGVDNVQRLKGSMETKSAMFPL